MALLEDAKLQKGSYHEYESLLASQVGLAGTVYLCSGASRLPCISSCLILAFSCLHMTFPTPSPSHASILSKDSSEAESPLDALHIELFPILLHHILLPDRHPIPLHPHIRDLVLVILIELYIQITEVPLRPSP